LHASSLAIPNSVVKCGILQYEAEESMDGYRHAIPLLALVSLFCLSGASCPTMRNPFYAQPAVPVLAPTATLDQVVQVVNANSTRVQSFYTNDATISVPPYPTLHGFVAFERPRRFRLQARLGFGNEFDLGSNDELFWFWVRRENPPAVYFCRHAQFEGCRVRQMIPIRPEWLIEALGANELDPNLPHQGPTTRSDGKLEIRTIRETADGPTTKITVVDPARGLVVEQHMYSAQGQVLASAVTRQHRRDPLSGLTVPQVVDIQLPVAQPPLSMRIDLGLVQVNRPAGDPAVLWTMPQGQGQLVDLCDPNLQLPTTAAPAVAPPGGTTRRNPPVRAWTRMR
jgi:hypothetical protein